MRMFRPFAAAVLLFAGAAGCTAAPTAVSTRPSGETGEKRLVIMHTNDIHASFVPHEAAWVKTTPRPLVGGFVRLQEEVDSIRATGAATLLLDAGDVMTGNPISEMEYQGALGGALFQMMDRVGYDAWCPGNHDLDISQENLRKLTRIAAFPTLCANLVDGSGNYPLNTRPYAIVERGGVRIGIIGLILQTLADEVLQQNLAGLKVLSPAETAQRFIDAIRPKVDLLILLTHNGADNDSALAFAVHGADVIVGGHSHTRIRAPRLVNGVRIVQTGSNLENLGVLEVTFDGKTPAAYAGRLLQLWQAPAGKPGSVRPLVDSVQQAVDREYDQVLGTLAEDWLRQTPGNPLAAFVSEVQRQTAMAQVGFMNTAGVRKDLTAGKITKRDIFEVMPFRNVIETFQLTGAELEAVVQYYLRKHPGIVITGISGKWSQRPDGSIALTGLRVGGEPLAPERSYVCAASDYFVGQAERYIGREIRNPSVSRVTVFKALEEQIRREGTLHRRTGMALEQVP